MDKKRNLTFGKYRRFLVEIDKQVSQLTQLHSKHLQCKKGCDLCCMDYKIFPVEFYSILDKLTEDNVTIDTTISNDNSCAFLKNHSCLIYKYRPVICRTHGLPLIYMNDDNEWELSNCELNFIDFDFEDFTIDNTFQQDKYNSRLYLLNKEFISGFTDEKYEATDLIPLKLLAKKIIKIDAADG